MNRAERKIRNAQIIARVQAGEPSIWIAKELGISVTTVYTICRGICSAAIRKKARNDEIAARALSGEPYKVIARKMGLSWNHCQKVVKPYRDAANLRRKPRLMHIGAS